MVLRHVNLDKSKLINQNKLIKIIIGGNDLQKESKNTCNIYALTINNVYYKV